MTVYSDVLRRTVSLRTPFCVTELPFLSKLHTTAFRHRKRTSKRFVGKPAKWLFRLLMKAGLGGTGHAVLRLPDGERTIRFNARNTQFGALYQPQNQPVYEPETSALLDVLVADGDVFLDVGANWGWYALLIASRPGYAGTVHAFEPYPPTFADLKSVVDQAGLSARIICHDVALADTEGTACMAFSDGIQSGLARLGEAGGLSVRMVPLDHLGLPAPGVIKIDAEDHELEVLQGAARTIAAARPFIVFENWLHPDKPGLTLDPFAFLGQHGYRFMHPAWVGAASDCLMAKPVAGKTELALVPFLPAQRFLLPQQLNVLAVPAERGDELSKRFLG